MTRVQEGEGVTRIDTLDRIATNGFIRLYNTTDRLYLLKLVRLTRIQKKKYNFYSVDKL